VGRSEILVTAVVSVAFEENCYVAHLGGRHDCLVIDPGLEPERIIQHLEDAALRPAAILNTHGHIDHFAGNEALKQRWPECPLVIGRGDAPKLTDARSNLSAAFGFPLVSPAADATVDEGDVYSAAGLDLHVRAIPGHSAGHVIYLWKDNEPMVAFVGDVIFAGGIGRTDFPDGDFEALAAGIRAKLYCLPDNTVLYCGHGPETTVGREKRGNPFVRA
jgi:glyoxylase-like metal-dependent hydrolase (beta-lactamase superfamily II)